MRTKSHAMRRLALVIGLLGAAAYFLTRNVTTDHVHETRDAPAAAGAASVETADVTLDSTVVSGRTGIAVSAALDPATVADADSNAAVVVVEVEVVDSDGRPASGVWVSAALPRDEGTASRASTDANGRATLRIEREWVSPGDVLQVGPDLVGSEPSLVRFTFEDPPKERVHFVVEPAGSIEITLVGGGTISFTNEDECQLYVERDRCNPAAASELHEYVVWAPLTARSLVFSSVRTNLCFTVYCRVRGRRFEQISFEGPKRSGERVSIEIPFARADTLVRGRLLRADGSPLSKHSLEMTPKFNTRGSFVDGVTDDDGMFSEYVAADYLPRLGDEIEVTASEGGAPSCNGRVYWPARNEAATVEDNPTVQLGNVVLAELPIVASGQVVDAEGKPTWGWVEVRAGESATLAFHERTYTSRVGTFQATSARTHDRFQLRAGTYRKSPGEPVEVRRGARDVVLVVRNLSRLSGRLLLPERVDIDQLDLDFRGVETPDCRAHFVSTHETFDDGTFQADRLEAGTYRVSVMLGEHELGAREGVIPPVGGIVQLEPIDLRDALHAVRLVVVTEGKEQLDEGEVSVIEGNQKLGAQRPTREGEVVLVARSKVVDVIAHVPGCLVERFDGVASGDRLELARGLPTTLRVEPVLELPPDHSLRIDLHLDGDDALALSSWMSAHVQAHGRASIHLPASGNYRTSIHLISKLDRHGRRTGFEQHGQLERSTRRESEEVIVRVDEAALRKAIDGAQSK